VVRRQIHERAVERVRVCAALDVRVDRPIFALNVGRVEHRDACIALGCVTVGVVLRAPVGFVARAIVCGLPLGARVKESPVRHHHPGRLLNLAGANRGDHQPGENASSHGERH
jgi:hypothetical protein